MKRMSSVLVIFFILLIPVAGFFSMPRKAHAFLGVGDVGVFMDPLTEIETTLGAVNTYASMIESYILEPVAFIASGRGVQQITSGVLQFVDGLANGTGVKQFIQNIRGTIQTVGDIQNTNFVQQFTQHSTSPFTSSIATALNLNYLQSTSLSGFFGGIQNTLLNTVNGSTASLTNFLNGDWSAGGASTWLALTTQDQNNPYTLYSLAQNEMGSLVSNAQSAKQTMANWGSGFTGWCGDTSQNSSESDSDQLSTAANSYATKFKSIAQADGLSDDDAFVIGNTAAESYFNEENNTDQVQKDLQGAFAGTKYSSGTQQKVINDIINYINTTDNQAVITANSAAKAGDPCTNPDGTPGTVQTPGSVIQNTLTNTLGLTNQKIAQIGDISGEISQLIGTISNIVKTTSGILGNSSSGSGGGLAAAANPATATSNQSAANNSYGGLSATQVFQDFENSQASSGLSDLDARTSQVNQYASDWAYLGSQAQDAMNNMQNLVYSCSDEMSRRAGGSKYDGKVASSAGNTRSGALQAVNDLDTIIQQANQVASSTQQYLSLMQKAKDAQASGDQNDYLSYYSQLQALPPTTKDITDTLTDIQTQGFASQVFPDAGSFTVNSGSLVNQIKYYQLRAWCGALPKRAASCNDVKGEPALMYWTASNEYVDPSWSPSSCQGLVAFQDTTDVDPNAAKPVSVSWTTTGATSISINQGIGEITTVASGATTTEIVPPIVFTGTVTDANGNIGYCSAAYDGAGPSATQPTCTLSSNPTSIASGGDSSLSWTTENAKWFSVSQNSSASGIGSLVPVTNGSTPVTNITAGTVYTGTAMDADGDLGLCSATVNVGTGPSCTLTVTAQ